MDETLITELISRWRDGDLAARTRLTEAVYPVLRQLARHQRRRMNAPSGLETTDLAHTVYLKMFNAMPANYENRRAFYKALSVALSRVLIDHFRQHERARKGTRDFAIETELLQEKSDNDRLLLLGQALATLADKDETALRVTELRFLCGFTETEAARELGISRQTVTRKWQLAQALLRMVMDEQPV
jgi:RNA polymerase sigma factor (TIGR02999 family)